MPPNGFNLRSDFIRFVLRKITQIALWRVYTKEQDRQLGITFQYILNS